MVRRASVGVFCVSKKKERKQKAKLNELGEEWLRLIFDCWQVNFVCRTLPKWFLVTHEALACLDLSPSRWGKQVPLLSQDLTTECSAALTLLAPSTCSSFVFSLVALRPAFSSIRRECGNYQCLRRRGGQRHLRRSQGLGMSSDAADGWTWSLFSCHPVLVQRMQNAL